jgi:hypothetical protein
MNCISLSKIIKHAYTQLAVLLVVLIPFLSACKNDAPDFNNPDNYKFTSTTGGGKTDLTPGEYYVKGTLNGQAINWIESYDANGYLTGVALDAIRDQGKVNGAISALFSGTGNNIQALNIQFETLNYLETDNKTTLFAGFLTTGVWPYASSAGHLAGKHVTVGYSLPGTGGSNTYSTRGDQSGNTFTVVSVTQVPAKAGEDAYAKIKITFSCKLYPITGVGTPITFTNVEAVLNISNIL